MSTTGGARGDLAFNWNDIDGDGKLYLDELASLWRMKSSPNIPGACVFDAHGGVSAEINIDWSVGVSIFSVSGSIPIVDVELFSFEYTCTDSYNIANLGADNTLVLNAGPNAGDRIPGANGDEAESFEVRQLAGGEIQVTFDLVVDNDTTVKLRKTFTGVSAIRFDGGGGNDSLIVDPSVSLPVTLIGGAGNDTLTGGSGPNTFAGGSGNDLITSRGANDTYLFENNWGVDTIVDSGGTSDKFDFSAVTSNLTATLGSLSVTSGANAVQGAGGGPVLGIESIAAGTGVDTLISTAVVGSGSLNNWTLNGVGTGNINGLIQFSRFENLTGGNPDDRFVFAGGSVTGVINGGAGVNTLDYSAVSQTVDVNRVTPTAPLIKSYSNIDPVIGGTSNADVLIGDNAAATWTLDGSNRGNIGGNFQFSSFENLTGGSSDDTFLVAANGSLTGKLLGSAGNDNVSLAGKQTALTATIQGMNRGRVVDGNQSLLVDFDNVENLTGGNSNDFIDRFVVEPLAGLSGKIDGGGGSFDHLDFGTWTTAIQVDLTAGTNRSVVNTTGIVAGIEHITGGSANDTLTGDASGNRIIGGGGADTIDGRAGHNLLIGDTAEFTPVAGGFLPRLSETASIRTLEDFSASDTIVVGDGNNIILPGSGNDRVSTGNGNNVVAGDQVLLTLSGGQVVAIQSKQSPAGGDDILTLGTGNDIVIGGNGNDMITDKGGRNVIIGDRGDVELLNGLPVRAISDSVDPGR